ncbi:MAG TPA: tRNA uridine-5-carboxymethylaminomethyl(34) synthesis enzyme MnmG [Bacilli bacterium]|nr:tRNA uridine-5-carboxymethylaminomethyl(34) synthesis enzyme MnmG [Bacilli bacterium]
MTKKYEIIVVGGGHAGCEAAYAAAKKGHRTLLVTTNVKNIADMPCNPSIGGTAKGIVVREIDALGGIMGKVTDKSHFQIKMLNSTKGLAVRSLRAQADKVVYPKEMLKALKKCSKLDILEGTVTKLLVKDKTILGVVIDENKKITGNAVILTTGTYLRSKILVGDKKTTSGPHGEKTSSLLSNNLKELGFEILRLKTGTPQRIAESSIDFSQMQEEYGDNTYYTFSYDNPPFYKINDQKKCYLIYTNAKTHEIIKQNLDKSSMYGGYVEGVGPRYCPSIEDKIVKFADKERHQLFLEPESAYYDEWYLQGFSTSMPHEIQEKMVHSLKGLEKAKIVKYAYAIEYDAINPLQVNYSLETKIINNLYTAGQINGTSGYEEAAAQGLMAGINASLKLEKKEPFILKRSDAYIGVLIDDLVTKGTKEPYRLLTSRAEFRLLLRHDNADLRLREKGYEIGLIDKKRYKKFLSKKDLINKTIAILKNNQLKLTKKVITIFAENNIKLPKGSIKYSELLKRPEISINFLKQFVDITDSKEILEEVEISIKYSGYIEKTYKEIAKMIKLEEKKIPANINYDKVRNLALEARQKLKLIKPISIGQASRISGVNPSDIAILAVYLKKEYSQNE